MITIQYSQIPVFLHDSAFYKSLCADDEQKGDDNVIEIPERCFKVGDEVANLDDFAHMLHAMQFWGVDEIPVGLMKYLDRSNISEWQTVAKDVLDPNSRLLHDLLHIFQAAVNTGSKYRFQSAVEKGRIELLKYWLSSGFYESNSRYMADIAATHGHVKCLEVLHKHKITGDARTAHYAVDAGHLDCLIYVNESGGVEWNSKVFAHAASNGHLHIMRYAYEQGLEWCKETYNRVMCCGHLDCLRFAHEHGCPWSDYTTQSAARQGQYDCLMYALEHGCPVTETAVNDAVECNHLECLQLLHQYNVPWSTFTTSRAATYGHIRILKYLLENNCPWDTSLYTKAVAGGYLHCVQYAYSQGLAWGDDPSLCALAAQTDHIGILQFLHENGARWGEDTVLKAVTNNYIEIVKYAIAHGCDWDKSCCTASTKSSYMLQYLLSQWTYDESELHSLVLSTARSGYVNILGYLVENLHYVLSSEDGSVFTAALSEGRLSCVQYCFERGCRRFNYDVFLSTNLRLVSDKSLLLCLQYLEQQDWQIPHSLSQFLIDESQRFALCNTHCLQRKSMRLI